MSTSSTSSTSSTTAATFRAKTNFMKSWRPRNPPSNRDRLELYALHKQSISGDAPPTSPTSASSSSSSSVAEKAKLAAWNNKRGLSQEDAMLNYIQECDRQLQVYGSRPSNGTTSPARSSMHSTATSNQQQQHQQQSTAESTSSVHSNGRNEKPSTPQNTPAGENVNQNNDGNNNMSNNDQGDNNDNSGDNGVLLCPRGLAAIPLLCAAASETRSAYLARLQVTHPSNGWWAKQEPLCLEVNNLLSIPERLIIGLAAKIEQISLIASEYMSSSSSMIVSPRVFQAFLWPVHNVLLCCWITFILTTTYLGSMVMMCQTLLFGAKRTNAPLGRLFMEEVHPAARAVESLCEQHQVIGVRVSGLVLMPLMMTCDFVTSVVVAKVGSILVGSLVFVGMGMFSWWYWICVLPWLAVCGLCLAVMSGWCFGLIELAGSH